MDSKLDPQKANIRFAILGTEGKCTGYLQEKSVMKGSLTYHDPCYLGRYNAIYDKQRSFLNSVAKDSMKELSQEENVKTQNIGKSKSYKVNDD